MGAKWRIRVSIPVPRRCERRTLPIELIPRSYAKRATLAGLEPATLRFEVLRAIHCATRPCHVVPVGFEPTRAEPTHLAGERLNHSAKASLGCAYYNPRAVNP